MYEPSTLYVIHFLPDDVPTLYFGSLAGGSSPWSLSGSESDLSPWISGFSVSASNEAPPVVDEAVGNDTDVAGGRTEDCWALEDSDVAVAVSKGGTLHFKLSSIP